MTLEGASPASSEPSAGRPSWATVNAFFAPSQIHTGDDPRQTSVIVATGKKAGPSPRGPRDLHRAALVSVYEGNTSP